MSLEIREKNYGPTHLNVARSYNGLGLTLIRQLRFEEAESAIKRAISILAQSVGEDHWKYGTALSNLSIVYIKLRKLDKAKILLLKALKIL